MTAGTVDVEDRWGRLASALRSPSRERSDDPAREAVYRLFAIRMARSLEPGETLAFGELLAAREGALAEGPATLVLRFEVQPGGCLFTRGRFELRVSLPAGLGAEVPFGPDDLAPAEL